MDEPRVDPRLLRLLGGEALAGLRGRLRQRYERSAVGGAFRLNDLSEVERNALAGLLGRPARRAGSMALDTAELDAALCHAGIASSLRDALERLDGLIVNRVAERAALQAQWDRLAAGYGEERLAALLDHPRGLSLLKRLARSPAVAARLLDGVQAVLAKLPAAGIPRSRLAADVLGDAHGLDQGHAVASLVLAALRPGLDSAEAQVAADDVNEVADESARAVWAGVGVLVNELARPALFLNLPIGDGQSPGSTPGQPGYLSLRALLRSPPPWAVAGRDIHVCENPNLIAIVADVLGSRCAPLVCTDGMPGAAQRMLLIQLARAGARLHYHGDFDWAGLRIGNWVMRACGALPWRYGTADYLSAVRDVPVHARVLGPDSVEADWDAGLASAMRAHEQAVDEEAVAADLMPDLDGSGLTPFPACC
ncbi:MAG: TIGR02679 family protein [Rhodocyclaceae bacterium]|nr:TIGR02679 family protein [Rhodocyclaceae bacterium]